MLLRATSGDRAEALMMPAGAVCGVINLVSDH